MGEAPAAYIQRVFQRFDSNGDGKISLSELTEALRPMGTSTSEDVKRMMAEMDTDGDGHIDLKEFSAFCLANPAFTKELAKVFA